MDSRRLFLAAAGHVRSGPSRAALHARIAGRTVLITGGGRGIGARLAVALATCGARLILVARSAAELDATASRCRAAGARVATMVVDLRDTERATACARRVLAEHGAPDVIVANAGHSLHRGVLASSERAHDVERTVAINYTGHAALLLPLLPHLPASSVIVGVSTAAVELPWPGWSAYLASKIAFDTWLRSIAGELAPRTAVSVVRLPMVATRMSAPSAPSRWSTMTATEAAQVLAHAIIDTPAVVAPWWTRVVGAATSLAPGLGRRAATYYAEHRP